MGRTSRRRGQDRSTKVSDLQADVALVLSDGDTWTYKEGSYIVLAPPGILLDKDGNPEPKPLRAAKGLKPPYGVIDIDSLLDDLPLEFIAKYRVRL